MKSSFGADLLIFDFDGTLIDSSADIAWVANRTLADLGYEEQGATQIKSSIGWGVKSLLEKLLPGEPDERIEEARRVFMGHYENHLTVETRPYPGVMDTLDYFRDGGKRLAIVTNKPISLTVKTLKSLSMESAFDMVLGGDSLDRRKPHPEPILKVMEGLGVGPDRVVFIGDSAVDCQAGKAAGVVTVGATYGFRGKDELVEAGCDYLIGAFDELRGLIG